MNLFSLWFRLFPFKQYKDYDTWSTTILPAPFCPKNQNSYWCDCFRSCIPQAIQSGSCWCPFFTNGRPHFFLTFRSRPGLGNNTAMVSKRPPMLNHFQQTGQEHRNSVQHTPRSPCCTCQHKFFLPGVLRYTDLEAQACTSYIMKLKKNMLSKSLCLPSFILQTCTHISNKISSPIQSGNRVIDSSDYVHNEDRTFSKTTRICIYIYISTSTNFNHIISFDLQVLHQEFLQVFIDVIDQPQGQLHLIAFRGGRRRTSPCDVFFHL